MCTHACACDAIQSLLCLLFLSDRSLVKLSSGTSGRRPQPTLQVLRFHSFFSSVPLPDSVSVAMAVCSPSPYQPLFTGPYCMSGSSNYKPRLASFISPPCFYFTIDLRTRAFICSNCSGRPVFWGETVHQPTATAA